MTSFEELSSGRPVAIDIDAIERELAALWKMASQPGEGETSSPLVHACLLNLVVVCDGLDEVCRISKIIAEVTRMRPSRVLLAVTDASQPGGYLNATVTAHCAYTPGAGKGKQVCCEEISLAASADRVERLPGAVLRLLLPDLPVVLWFPADPDLTSPNAKRLIAASDRLVVDSRRFTDVAARVCELAPLHAVVSDLGWHRLRGWRELTAGVFDSPAFAAHPARLETIKVEYLGMDTGNHAAAAEALLLGAWAASQLGWHLEPGGTPAKSGALSFELLRPEGSAGRLTLEGHPPDTGGGPAGRVVSLTLESKDAVFLVQRAESSETLSLSITIPDACGLPRAARAVERDEATLLCRCLETSGRDEVYERTLHLAALMLGRQETRQ
ncbi:MAG TPA: glucose-6-phosphate dehydrogenase assembly protein OpcA [Candidatus Polarisedimenticolia bacterium]|nr:glucose-6-phosphate dehydrogenase assembly protein OpcA [Candidatus Polarisedimenticolia bacterium]